MYQVNMYIELDIGQVEYKEFISLSEAFDYLRNKEPIKFVVIKRIRHE